MKAGFQGIKGAFSEAALYKYFDENIDAIGFPNIEDVFEAVVTGNVSYGIIPVENSIAGSVSRSYDFFLTEKVFAIAEVYLPIRHYLLGKPGTDLKQIQQALSHPMALHQCEAFLQKHDIKPVPEYDTAGAAKMVAEAGKSANAAVASELAAKYYRLDILAENIQTTNTNVTRFLIIQSEANVEGLKEKTSIAFKTKHHPGALEECLHTLSSNGINLTQIQSRPVPENPWEYVFYADFEGGVDDVNVQSGLGELESASKFLKVLGSYPKGNQ